MFREVREVQRETTELNNRAKVAMFRQLILFIVDTYIFDGISRVCVCLHEFIVLLLCITLLGGQNSYFSNTCTLEYHKIWTVAGHMNQTLVSQMSTIGDAEVSDIGTSLCQSCQSIILDIPASLY